MKRMSRREVVEEKGRQAKNLLSIANATMWSAIGSGLELFGGIQGAMLTSAAIKKLQEIEDSCPKRRRVHV